MNALRPRRLISAAAAAAVWAVLAPAPSAFAGHGDPARADRIAASLQVRAASAAQFGAQTGDPRFFAFANAANAVAVESGVLREKLAAGDLVAVRVCTAKLGRIVKDVDKLEDRLPRRAACGRSLRAARKAADRLADGIEDTYDDLEDEVEDLRPVRPVGYFAPAPRRPVAPVCPTERPVVVTPPVVVCPGPATCTIDGCDHGLPTGVIAPRWDGRPYDGRYAPHVSPVPQSDYRDRDSYYGPSRGLTDLTPRFGAPVDGFDDFPAGGLYDSPDAFDRDRFDGNGYRSVPRRDDGYVPPALPAPGVRFDEARYAPRDRDSRGRSMTLPGRFEVSWRR